MAKQTKSKTKKSGTTRKTKKRTRKKTAAEDASPEAAETSVTALAAEADPSDTAGATAPEAATKKRRKKTTTARKRKKKVAASEKTESESGADSATDTTEDAPTEAVPSRVEPTNERSAAGATSKAEIERSDESIVIRFPPVAPPPFSTSRHAEREVQALVDEPEPDDEDAPDALDSAEPLALAQEPAPTVTEAPEPWPTEEEGAREEEPSPPQDIDRDSLSTSAGAVTEAGEEPEAPSRRRRRRRRRRSKPTPETADERSTETDGSAATVDDRTRHESEEEQLSASKKRRLRRLRREQRNRGVPESSVAADEDAEEFVPEEEEADTEAEAVAAVFEEGERDTDDEFGLSEGEPVSFLDTDALTEEVPEERATRRRRRRRRSRRDDIDEDQQEDEAEAAAEEDVSDADDSPALTGAPPTREMIINVAPREECRIAILHEGKLEEIYIERASAENHVGNIYKGIVTNVEPSIQAAFIDFGLGKNGFLHISDLHPQYFPNGGQPAENVGRKMPRRSRPPIQKCLRRGQQVIVQITKEGIGTKGPTLSTYLSIPGRFLVMMPGMRRLGVSRKIEDDDVRQKIRAQLHELELPDGMGFIARTAAAERTKRELQSDLKYLMRLWGAVKKRIKNERPPAELYRESDLVIRTIRDLYSTDIGRINVDDPAVADRAREFLRIFSPRSGDVVHEYDGAEPIFHRLGIEEELERLHARHVPLSSGGSLVIDQTEALVAIDVNSGRFRTEDDAETTAFKINMEAADEIARQLRLRDLGGVIVCDFIDMRLDKHKRKLERHLNKQLKEHKERAKILRMSQFGIIEMTRQRQRASLTRSVYQDCRHCRGTGLVKTSESVALDVMRRIQLNVIRDQIRLIEITVSPEVSNLLLNRKRTALNDLESRHRRTITIRPEPNFGLDQVELRCYDHRGRPVPHA